MSKEKLAGHVAAVFTIIFWSTTYTATKLLLKDFSATEIIFYRFAIAYIALWAAAPRMIPFRGIKKELPFIGMGLCGSMLYYVFQNTALELTTASNVSVLIPLAVLFTSVLSQLIFKEKVLTPRFAAGCAISLIGAAIITLNGKFVLELNPLGDLLAMLAALSWAGYSICIRFTEGEDYAPIPFTRRIFFWGLLFLAPLLPFVDFRFGLERFADPLYLGNMLFLALGASGLCYLTWNFAVKRLGVITTSLYIYTDPLFSVAIAALVLKERVTWFAVLGIMLILSGLLLVNARGGKNVDKNT